jgi:hypothetical protein
MGTPRFMLVVGNTAHQGGMYANWEVAVNSEKMRETGIRASHATGAAGSDYKFPARFG